MQRIRGEFRKRTRMFIFICAKIFYLLKLNTNYYYFKVFLIICAFSEFVRDVRETKKTFQLFSEHPSYQ